jgi:hypothetical protein
MSAVEGRWTKRVCPICGGDGVQLAHGRCVNGCRGDDGVIPPMVDVAVVPVDDAAVERVARALFADYSSEHESTWEDDRDAFITAAEAVLRAAGETP